MTTEQKNCKHEFNEETGYCINCFDNVHSVRKATTEQKNKEVSEWLGIVPYISPGGHERHDFPDFSQGTGIIRLLELMMKVQQWTFYGGVVSFIRGGKTIIPIDYITTPGKLLDAVWEWSKEHHKL